MIFPEKAEAIRANRTLKFRFPVPDIPTLRLSTRDAPILTMANCEIGWMTGSPVTETRVLQGVTMQITMKTRMAVVGRNGQGKSSLLSA